MALYLSWGLTEKPCSGESFSSVSRISQRCPKWQECHSSFNNGRATDLLFFWILHHWHCVKWELKQGNHRLCKKYPRITDGVVKGHQFLLIGSTDWMIYELIKPRNVRLQSSTVFACLLIQNTKTTCPFNINSQELIKMHYLHTPCLIIPENCGQLVEWNDCLMQSKWTRMCVHQHGEQNDLRLF